MTNVTEDEPGERGGGFDRLTLLEMLLMLVYMEHKKQLNCLGLMKMPLL